jgi:hypothetical protein
MRHLRGELVTDRSVTRSRAREFDSQLPGFSTAERRRFVPVEVLFPDIVTERLGQYD